MALNVMVLESEPNVAGEATRELLDAGHTVLSCHDAGAPAFPCRGLVDPADCPLSSHTIDVALVVRPITRAQPTLREDGARCALMRRVPLVVAGSSMLSPYEGLATRAIEHTFDVVGACEAAAADPIVVLTDRATAAVRQVAASPDARAEVTRREGRLHVVVENAESMTKDERGRAAVAIVATVREADPHAAGIDVVVAGEVW